MDKITESIRKYLDSADIPHQTIFNGENGQDMEYPTSTCFLRENGRTLRQRTSVVVDIFPRQNQFQITSSPMAVFGDENMDELRDFESMWNRCSMMTSLVVKEAQGVTMLDSYCFTLFLSGFCDSNGLAETIWKKYIERIEYDTFLAWKKVGEIVDGFYGNPNEITSSDDLPF